MREIPIDADQLVRTLLALPSDANLCLLDSCGVGHLGSHLLIAGVRPVAVREITNRPVNETMESLDAVFNSDLAVIFTISYDFGRRAHDGRDVETSEPDIFAAAFPALIVHDYDLQKTFLAGDPNYFDDIEHLIVSTDPVSRSTNAIPPRVTSNFSKSEYLAAVETIKEHIRSGETYQANLTQQIRVRTSTPPEQAFLALRQDHPAPFAAYLRRSSASTVVSASPERFFRIANGFISTSPIKGTRPRGKTPAEDADLRAELLASEKDRAENTMIVDLLRNDIGRVCEFGSVAVENLCDLEVHPTLFHLVSTIRGKLVANASFSDVIRATFPCGSITGAPKIRTMEIIDILEPDSRGLSMGAVGVYTPPAFGVSDAIFDVSVAIRTMTFSQDEASFNVGGGITIDSDAEAEYAESLLKAKALLVALGASAEAASAGLIVPEHSPPTGV